VTVRYARRGQSHIAYDTLGDGPIDILHFTSMLISIDALDEEPRVARYYRRLASFARVIHFDAPGIGRSDPLDPDRENTVAQAALDALAVLDAAGSERAAVVAWSGAGPISIELAVRFPERVTALVLGDTYARLVVDDDYPEGLPAELIEGFLRDNVDPDAQWDVGGSDDVALLAPSLANDVRYRQWMQRASNRSASPATARSFLTMTSGADVRAQLPEVAVPTLVLHRARNHFTPLRFGRYLAARIPDAKLVVLPGEDQLPWTADADGLLDEIEEFLTGQRHGSADRVLTTVLFTDIVDSTQRASMLGDLAWRGELDAHDAIVRAQLGRFGGREVNTTGDGFVAMFDAPTAAVQGALAILEATRAAGYTLRAGVHTGECERRGDDLAGLAVHIAARVAARADANEVLVSRTVSDVVAGSGLVMESRGEYELKGLSQRWELFAVQP
jgi:class 3 adenylate cyclase